MTRRGRKGGPAPSRRVEPDADDPIVLAMDTGSASDALALAQGDLVIASRFVRRRRRQGAALAASVRDMLASVRVEPDRLAAIATGVGPGAFTGLRVGIATAQGLAAALGIPTWGFCSAAAWAATSPASDRQVAVTLDARRSEVYTALYDVGEAGLSAPLLPVGLCAPGEWFETLAARSSDPYLLVGDGARLYRDDARRILGDRARLPAWADMAPDVGWMALQGVARVVEGAPSELLRPLYLRDHDAARSA